MFVDHISTHPEEAVKFVEYCLVDFALVFCGVCGVQYTFRLFADAVEKSVDLLHWIIGCQSGSGILSRDQFSQDQLPPDQLSRDQLATRSTQFFCNVKKDMQ